jgi:hypothetical protein
LKRFGNNNQKNIWRSTLEDLLTADLAADAGQAAPGSAELIAIVGTLIGVGVTLGRVDLANGADGILAIPEVGDAEAVDHGDEAATPISSPGFIIFIDFAGNHAMAAPPHAAERSATLNQMFTKT